MSIVTFGDVEPGVMEQIERCLAVSGAGAKAVLCADNHKGYGMPIGGVIASAEVVMPAAVGYDIGCGNMAVRTTAKASCFDIARVMDSIAEDVSFGIGRTKAKPVVDHTVFDKIAKSPSAYQRSLLDLAKAQLGTVGSGNHYVDLFEDRADGQLWVGVHFGSRGFGHKTATYYLEKAGSKDDSMDAVPATIPLWTELANEYLDAMSVAGGYAKAGRQVVVDQVLDILGVGVTTVVHNHHNFAWIERYDCKDYLVTRKGATPARPFQQGFIGGSMGDDAVIVEGVNSVKSAEAMFSTVHGAGRVMGRMEARGKWKGGVCVREPKIDWKAALDDLKAKGIELRGGGADEAPGAYKRLPEVLKAHEGTIRITNVLRPIGVAMAGANEVDPYKD